MEVLLTSVQEDRPEAFEAYGPYHGVGRTEQQRIVDAVLYEAPGNRHRAEMLFGREDMRQRVHQMLDDGRQVLLYGAGGTGKTALAAAIADQRIEDGRGPVIWLELGHEDADAVLDALVRRFATEKEKLEIRSFGDDARILKVRDLLARTEAGLLVMDNVWNGRGLYLVLKAVPEEMPVLATSRQRFALEEMVEVSDLAREAALELLGYYAGKDYRLDEDAQALCKDLGWHAYAIEIASKTLKVDQLSPAELARQIAAAPHDLPMPEEFAEDGRESVKELLDGSFHALDEQAQQVFQAFGRLFAPGATSALLARVLELDQPAIEKQLRILVRRSLAKRSPDTSYYYLHDLTGSYARALVKASGQDRKEILGAIAGYVDQHVSDLEGLALDLDNILGAASVARTEDVKTLIAIMSALALGGYMDARGHTPVFLSLLDEAITAVRELIAAGTLEGEEEKETLHYLLGKRGNAHFDQGELDRAYEVYQESLELAPDDKRRVMLLAVQGKVRSEQGQYEAADDLFERGTVLAETTGDLRALAFLLQQRSHASGQREDFEAARDFAASAVQICQRPEMENPIRLGYCLINLGTAELDAGIDRALSLHQQARDIAQAEDNLDLMAPALYGLGQDYHALDKYDDAQQHLSEARRLYQECGNTAKEIEVTAFMKQYGYSME